MLYHIFMRDPELVIKGSFCEGDFMYGLESEIEVIFNAKHRKQCRFFPDDCPALNPNNGPLCIPKTGQEVARFVVKDRTSVAEELQDFAREAPMPPYGYFDPTKEEVVNSTTDRPEITRRIGVWATRILGIEESESATINKEFTIKPSQQLAEKYPVLTESVFDEDTSTWLHSCGNLIVSAVVHHPVWNKLIPLSGSGRVQIEDRPYCSGCQQQPSERGSPVYE